MQIWFKAKVLEEFCIARFKSSLLCWFLVCRLNCYSSVTMFFLPSIRVTLVLFLENDGLPYFFCKGSLSNVEYLEVRVGKGS